MDNEVGVVNRREARGVKGGGGGRVVHDERLLLSPFQECRA